MSATPATILEPDQAEVQFGQHIAAAGDVNGDGFADALVSTTRYNTGTGNAGAAFVYHGSPAGLSTTPAATFLSPQAGSAFGSDVAGVGDLNGDGFGDIIVGSSLYDLSHGNEGAAFVYYGSSSGISTDTNILFHGTQLSGDVGREIANIGDTNGDGFNDLIITNPTYLFYGSGGTGRALQAEQLHVGGDAIPVGGTLLQSVNLKLQMPGHSSTGRSRVKLQVELCPSGTLFEDPGCTTQTNANWIDTGNDGTADLTETFIAPAKATYHWRARVLYAPYSVTRAGITSPPNPAHGPWRRLDGQTHAVDLRARFDNIFCNPVGLVVNTIDISDARLYRAGDTLSTSGAVNIQSGADVVFEAGTAINLNTDFSAQSGSQLSSLITPVDCGSNNRPAATPVTKVAVADTTDGAFAPVAKSSESVDSVPAPRFIGFDDLPPALLARLQTLGLEVDDLADIQQSASGEQTVFSTEAALLTADTNGLWDVYRYQSSDESLWLVSTNAEGFAGNGTSDQPRIDGWGDYITFRTQADDLVDSDTNGVSDILLHQVQYQRTERISLLPGGGQTSHSSANPTLGGESLVVIYDREDSEGKRGLYYYDHAYPLETQRIDIGDCDAHHPQLSTDGLTLAYLCGEPQTEACTVEFIDVANNQRGSMVCPADMTPEDYTTLLELR